MFFDEEEFPLEISYGSSFSVKHNVQVTKTENDSRYTWLRHPYPVFRQSCRLSKRTHGELITEVIDLFHRVGGAAGGFRLHHHLDYSTNQFIEAPTDNDQLLLDLGSDQYQLVRWYGTEGVSTATRREIKKPKDGTTVVSIGGVSAHSSQFSVDTTTGIVTLSSISKTISGITQAAQAVVTLNNTSSLQTGMSVVFQSVAGMTQINGLRGIIVAIGGGTITVDIDSTGFSAYSSGGTVQTNATSSEAVRAGCEFDIPCCFVGEDFGDATYADYDATDITISVEEILNP